MRKIGAGVVMIAAAIGFMGSLVTFDFVLEQQGIQFYSQQMINNAIVLCIAIAAAIYGLRRKTVFAGVLLLILSAPGLINAAMLAVLANVFDMYLLGELSARVNWVPWPWHYFVSNLGILIGGVALLNTARDSTSIEEITALSGRARQAAQSLTSTGRPIDITRRPMGIAAAIAALTGTVVGLFAYGIYLIELYEAADRLRSLRSQFSGVPGRPLGSAPDELASWITLTWILVIFFVVMLVLALKALRSRSRIFAFGLILLSVVGALIATFLMGDDTHVAVIVGTAAAAIVFIGGLLSALDAGRSPDASSQSDHIEDT